MELIEARERDTITKSLFGLCGKCYMTCYVMLAIILKYDSSKKNKIIKFKKSGLSVFLYILKAVKNL